MCLGVEGRRGGDEESLAALLVRVDVMCGSQSHITASFDERRWRTGPSTHEAYCTR